MNLDESLRAKEDEITKIIASLSIEDQLNSPLIDIRSEMSLDIKKIAGVIELLLSDQMLYKNRKLKHKVLESKNGWIGIKYVLNLNQMKNTLKQVDFFNLIEIDLLIKFIRVQLQFYPCSLLVNQNFIRRRIPFVDKIKMTKPIRIQGYREQVKMASITQCLSSITLIYKIKFKIGQGWAIVLAAEPQKILEFFEFQATKKMEIDNEKNDYCSANLPFKAFSYETIIRQNPICIYTYNSPQFSALKPLAQTFIKKELKVFNISFFDRAKQPLFQHFNLQNSGNQPYLKSLNKSQKQEESQEEFSSGEKDIFMQQHLTRFDSRQQQKQTKQNISMRQKCKQRIHNFLNFYNPNFQFNSKFLSNQHLTSQSEASDSGKTYFFTRNDEEIIDEALNSKVFKFLTVKQMIF